MIGDADTALDERKYEPTKGANSPTPVPFKIRLIIAAIFIVGCMVVFLPYD